MGKIKKRDMKLDKQYRLIGVRDNQSCTALFYSCDPCARKNRLDLCGTPRFRSRCQFCQAESIYDDQ